MWYLRMRDRGTVIAQSPVAVRGIGKEHVDDAPLPEMGNSSIWTKVLEVR